MVEFQISTILRNEVALISLGRTKDVTFRYYQIFIFIVITSTFSERSVKITALIIYFLFF